MNSAMKVNEIRRIDTNYRVVPNPDPPLNDGGDCGPCVLAGLCGVSVQEAYQELLEFEEPRAATWSQMSKAARRASRQGFLSDCITKVPLWPPKRPDTLTWGLDAALQSSHWNNYIKMALQGGYAGIAHVDMHREGGPLTNHWLAIVGWRHSEETDWCGKGPDEGGDVRKVTSHTSELLLSCSARQTNDEEWIEVSDFLETMGGFNVILAKPKEN